MVIMTHYKKGAEQQLDRDWVILIKQAKELGITEEEIRDFLQHQRTNILVPNPHLKTAHRG
ncbi:anti-repressor SinI family protein [Virgibacillus sp. JSM 102003]|uniref:anti-repressor SinI family protein n=1 Tax=Virgibacillus sp. JSM 102003 TaxID=1562108 RepID=UPI0035C16A7E